MAQSKHTSGPWSQYHDDPLVIVDTKGSSLGEMVPGDPYISHDEALAKARLTAAAPELLAALKDCAVQIAQTRNRRLTADEQAALDAARVAIAKAEGGAT